MGTISKWFNRTIGSIKFRPKNRGQSAEHQAEQYLRSQGLKLLHRNYVTKAGEIDLIMTDQEEWVFIEVRYKHSDDWASPAESITIGKQNKIIKAAQHYLLKYDKIGNKSCRFDVMLMSGEINSPQIEWIQHAFY